MTLSLSNGAVTVLLIAPPTAPEHRIIQTGSYLFYIISIFNIYWSTYNSIWTDFYSFLNKT